MLCNVIDNGRLIRRLITIAVTLEALMLCNVIDNGRLIRRLIIAFLTSEALMLCNVIVNRKTCKKANNNSYHQRL